MPDAAPATADPAVSTRLMLATLLRHEQRTDAAVEQLNRLELLETAEAWRHEIAQERERIRSASVIPEDKIYELPTQEESTKTIATTRQSSVIKAIISSTDVEFGIF